MRAQFAAKFTAATLLFIHLFFSPGPQAAGARQRGPAVRAAQAGEAPQGHHGEGQGAGDGAQGGQGGSHEGQEEVRHDEDLKKSFSPLF